jgi:mitochondrial fission protein ELM1
MKPALAALNRFDLCVIPEHDGPPSARNVVHAQGALNLITPAYLEEQARLLRESRRVDAGTTYAGFLIGGGTKDFTLDPATVRDICRQLAGLEGCRLMVTTSRRSSPEVEAAVKDECSTASVRIIASEDNPPFAVGGILGCSSVVVCTPESISMISEAATSSAHVVVFRAPGLGARHRKFLENLDRKRHIHLVEPGSVGAVVQALIRQKPAANPLRDAEAARPAVRKALS